MASLGESLSSLLSLRLAIRKVCWCNRTSSHLPMAQSLELSNSECKSVLHHIFVVLYPPLHASMKCYLNQRS